MSLEMAHFAKLDANNIVIDVLVVSNDDVQNLPFPESEPIGVSFLEGLFGKQEDVVWKQTSYNRSFRGNYAGIGYVYDSSYDVFTGPQPFPSWTLNPNTWLWEAPTPIPLEYQDKRIDWDEASLSWIERAE